MFALKERINEKLRVFSENMHTKFESNNSRFNTKMYLFSFLMGIAFAFCFTGKYFVANIYNSINCANRWNHSAYQTQYTPYAGCLVSKDGIDYTPERTIREAY